MAQLLIESTQSDTPLLLEAMSKADACWTADERMELLNCIVIYTRAGATSFFHVLGTEKIDVASRNTDHFGKNALHILAAMRPVIYFDTALKDKWIDAVRRHAIDSRLLHARYKNTGTPFAKLLNEVLREWTFWGREQEIVQLWVRCLFEAGIDLLSYGEREYKHLRERYKLYKRMRENEGFMEFTYGPDPKDWRIWLTHSGDVYAGIFWYLVECGNQQIPGAWVEEDDVPQSDTWRRGHGARRIGIKRRILRRLRAKMKRQSCVHASDAELIEKLFVCVKQEEDSFTGGDECSPTVGQEKKMLDLATLLGITTPEFRRDW